MVNQVFMAVKVSPSVTYKLRHENQIGFILSSKLPIKTASGDMYKWNVIAET
jgi:hypothetical protein